jgi:2''-aminoglycoside nucleotidyltransferase
MNDQQLQAIKEIFTKADEHGLPLWLDGGWSIDALLGKITREHSDIDLGFPGDRRAEYLEIIKEAGFTVTEEMSYGFLAKRGDVLLDSEACVWVRDHYEAEGVGEYPENACPDETNATLSGVSVRCMSWEKMYYEFLFLDKEVPRSDWKPKHYASLEIIELHISPERREELKQRFATR